MVVRVSKHSIAKPNEYQTSDHVDPAGLDRRTFTLPREILKLRDSYTKKSAEAIVVGEHELRTDTAEDSQNDEGLNIKMFQMQQGSANWWKSCYKRNRVE